MDRIIIKGGARLTGEVSVSGAKNAALPILAACLLTDEPCVISNVPDLKDVETFRSLLSLLGVKSRYLQTGVLEVTPVDSAPFAAPYDLVRKMRASILVLGPLLTKRGQAHVSLPGGCAIGSRPVNLHLRGLAGLGAKIKVEHGYIEGSAGKLKGGHLIFDVETVTGTENLMMAAVLAEGETVIENAAREPEVADLADFLNKMGAKISGAGTETIRTTGVKRLHGARHTVISDRIEAATFMIAAGITGGDITLKNCPLKLLSSVVAKLTEAGISLSEKQGKVRVKSNGSPKSVDLATAPYPGFPTDVQAQMMALMSVAHSTSLIRETIFENRFMHALELKRMGADLTIDEHSVIVRGRPQLTGAEVMATDLRASAGLVLAALRAEGKSTVSRIYHLDRGYEHLENKLRALGADIKRVS
ncbi:MAG: UDP-N-acetylglucosamine 1-carboxyvinyltransferase [bacterium]